MAFKANIYKKCFTFQSVPVLLLIIVVALVSADDYDQEEEESNYEPSDNACERCNCSSVALESSGESGILFTIDCTTKNVQHLFNKWPEEMGDVSHSGKLTS